MTIFPKRWAESMRAESQSWQIRCCTCGATRSVWEAGGIRWKAYSRGKRTLIRCSHCGRIRVAAVERAEKPEAKRGSYQ